MVIATYVLLVINIVVFLVDIVTGGGKQPGMLTNLGAKDNAAILAGQYWRFITPVFLHWGLLHIGFNSYFLYIIGPQVERAFGWVRFMIIYLLAGLAGSIASFALTNGLSVGASGALFGLIGALIPFFYRNRGILAGTRRRIVSVAEVIGINLLIGLSPGIDNWAHVGGLIAGLAAAWFMTPLYTLKPDGLIGDDIRVEDQSSPAGAVAAGTSIGAILIVVAYWMILLKG